jgi:transposase
MNTKLHAICDSQGRPLNLFVTAGQVSDYIGARALLSSLPDVDWLLGDRGYDADWFREALKDKGIRACIPGRKQRKKPVKYDKRRYKRRNRIEIMFGRLKDWRRWRPDTTGARRSSSQPSPSPQPSSTGYES